MNSSEFLHDKKNNRYAMITFDQRELEDEYGMGAVKRARGNYRHIPAFVIWGHYWTQFYVFSADGDYDGYSCSGHGWETYSDDRSEHGDRSGHSDSSGSSEDEWYTYSINTIWSDNDDEDYWITNFQ